MVAACGDVSRSCTIPSSFCPSPCSSRDLVGFIAGLASICCWLVAQMPQLYRNYTTQSAEALSAWFLSSWLLVGARSSPGAR